MSPRASTVSRFPVGEMSPETMNSEASIFCARNVGRSPGIEMSIRLCFFVFKSTKIIFGPLVKTISPSPAAPGPIEGHLQS